MHTPKTIIFILSLAALGKPSPDPTICKRAHGKYDVCDTSYSYVTCNGHEAVSAYDCIQSSDTFCRVVEDKGKCYQARDDD
ncbi:hypothetical protein GGS20DRAFT_582108 [Poronia punctata]|nr:hypothetical protein GGS20DRAFT_582108 [Poronia punctata]